MTSTFERFSFFPHANDSGESKHTGNIDQLHKKLTTSAAWKLMIDELRALPADKQTKEKEKLPAFTPSVVIVNDKRKQADGEFVHTHLIQADFDKSDDFDKLFDDLCKDEHARLIFRSPSNKVKALIKMSSVETKHDHKSAFESVAAYCLERGYGVIDARPKNINCLCFISYDPTSILKDATPLPWTPLPERKSASDTKFEGKPDPKALDFIPNNCDYETWLTVGMAIKDAGLGVEVFEEWTGGGRQRSNGEWEAEDIQAHWDRYNGEGITWGSVVYLAKQNGYKPPLPSDSPAESPYFYRSRFSPRALMDALDEDFDFLALPTEKYLRVYKNGVYTLDSGGRLKREIHERLGSRLQAKYITETLELLRQRHMLPMPENGEMPCVHPEVVNIKNGLYYVRKGELKPHTPEFKSIVQLPVTYDKDAECPEIDGFLKDVLGAETDDITLAYEIIGYSMLMQLPIAKLFVLLGPTHTGKSTFLDILTALLGVENTSGVSLQALDDDTQRFVRAGLYGKLANISADLSKRSLAGDSKIKMIVAGDRFDVERKGVDSFSMRPFATVICAANDMPRSSDRSDAWLERITILPFVNQHKGDDAERGLIQKLTTPTELSGLFRHAIVAVRSLLSAGKFTESASVIEARENYGLMNDQVLRFLTENYVRQADSSFKDDAPYRLPESKVYDSYKEWCDGEGISKPTTKVNFRDSVEKWTGEKRVRRRGEGERSNANRSFAFQKLIPIEDSGTSSDDPQPSVVVPPHDNAIPF